jgi:hypothetical protein
LRQQSQPAAINFVDQDGVHPAKAWPQPRQVNIDSGSPCSDDDMFFPHFVGAN